MMDLTELLVEAATLMGVGMIAVFAFLSLLIVAVNGLAKLAPPLAEVAEPKQTSSPTPQPANNATVVAAISAAVQQYRKAQ
ncbi:OadG family transporter subunit [Agarivorans aestuarii]|uniref:Probable oxaloacetate decarboxylase gamma chain n=1 Tax=Agarivorans aestuarii TaxID=1563703 RepID=A0ABU7GAC8_9ALTE|nr:MULTISPECIES: OadG family transporter subunit [Agarivorans]MEE1676348.1 OadG family transporter subunit [Agarivorans aestuarii]